MTRSVITFPAPPPSPPQPVIAAATLGALGSRTEYYFLTFLNQYGETLPGLQSAISLSANTIAVISPPPYPYPFSIYGYNVYASLSPSVSSAVLQNSSPILPGLSWAEPVSGLATGPTPSFGWTSTSLTFGTYSYPTKVPAYQRSVVRHSNVAASGVLETIYEHTDYYISFEIPWVQIGTDISNWNNFVAYAEQGGVFSFLPDLSIGLSGAQTYTLWDSNWDAAYKSAGFYTFKMKWRQALNPPGFIPGVSGCMGGGGGGGGGTVTFVDDEIPVDSGDHQHFTLANTPNPSASLLLFLEGTGYPSQFLFPGGVDYTLTANSIVLVAALSGTFNLGAYYRF